MAGESGVACMDVIGRELIDTGYLHNHARMWWASFWIHVEKLPWELGADFFFRYLLDADPASNTLSWRWVAGLQTPGKTYLVRLSNRDLLPQLRANLEARGVRLTLIRRPTDETAFSFATAGFFPFWQKMRRHLNPLVHS